VSIRKVNLNKTVSHADLIPEQSCTFVGERTDAHKATFLQRLLSAAFYRLLVAIYHQRLLRAVLLEFRSLFLRIQILRRTKLYAPGNLRNPRLFFHAREYPPSCECEIACIQDTGAMLSKNPWATALDLALFWEGWDMGASAHLCRKNGSSCCCKRSKESKA